MILENQICLNAYFAKATTLVDGGWRISFDLLSTESQSIADLALLKDQGLCLVVMTEDQVKNAKVAKK